MTLIRLYEFLHIMAGGSFPIEYIRSGETFQSQMASVLEHCFGSDSAILSSWNGQEVDQQALNEKLFEAVDNVGILSLPKISDLSTLYADLAYGSEDVPSGVRRIGAVLNDMAGWIVARSDYYAKLSGYRDQAVEEGLLSPVSSSSKYASRYNEIPGDNGTLENYYDDDSHATSTDRRVQEVTSDMDTKMARLREIIAGYPHFVGDFAREFEERYGIYERIKV